MYSINNLKKNLGQQPGSLKEHAELINELNKKGQHREAIQRYHSVITKLKDTVDNHLIFGKLAINLGLLSGAETQFEAALQLSPANITVLIALAGLYIERGQISLALPLIEQIIFLDPENKFARNQQLFLSEILHTCRINHQDLTNNNLQNTSICLPDIAYSALVEQILNKYPQKYEPVPRRLAISVFNLRNGGIQKKVVNMVRRFQFRNDEIEHVKIFCKLLTHRKEDAFLLPRLKEYGIEIEEYFPPDADQSPFTHPHIEDYAELLRPIYKTGTEIAHLILALIIYKPEVFHGFGYQAAEFGIAAVLAGVPRVILHSGNMRPSTMDSRDYWQDHSRAMGHAYQALARLPNVTITNNCQAAASDYDQWLNLPSGRVQTIYNGVDFDTYSRLDKKETDKKRKLLGIPLECPVVGSAIRFVQQKRPLLWLETAALVARERPDVHFVLLGDGPLLEQSKEVVRSRNLADRFHFPGTVTDMNVWYGMMNIVLLTSVMEGTSNVAIEAQCQGIPVVSTDVGGMRETLLHSQSGWLVDSPEPTLLAERIIWIMEHPEWYAEAGKIGREFVQQRFSMENMINKVLNFSWDNL